MTERTLLLFSGLLLLHYVAAQGPKTAWQAGGVGMGVVPNNIEVDVPPLKKPIPKPFSIMTDDHMTTETSRASEGKPSKQPVIRGRFSKSFASIPPTQTEELNPVKRDKFELLPTSRSRMTLQQNTPSASSNNLMIQDRFSKTFGKGISKTPDPSTQVATTAPNFRRFKNRYALNDNKQKQTPGKRTPLDRIMFQSVDSEMGQEVAENTHPVTDHLQPAHNANAEPNTSKPKGFTQTDIAKGRPFKTIQSDVGDSIALGGNRIVSGLTPKNGELGSSDTSNTPPPSSIETKPSLPDVTANQNAGDTTNETLGSHVYSDKNVQTEMRDEGHQPSTYFTDSVIEGPSRALDKHLQSIKTKFNERNVQPIPPSASSSPTDDNIVKSNTNLTLPQALLPSGGLLGGFSLDQLTGLTQARLPALPTGFQSNEMMNYERMLILKTLAGLVKTMGMLQNYIIDSKTTTAATQAQTTSTSLPTTTSSMQVKTLAPFVVPYRTSLPGTRPTIPSRPAVQPSPPTTTTTTTTTPLPITTTYITPPATMDYFETTTDTYIPSTEGFTEYTSTTSAGKGWDTAMSFVKSFVSAVAKTTPTEASPPQPEAKKAVTQQTRMNQLEDLLKGISASDLQNLVDIIKTKASGSRAEPAATATSEPPKPAPRDPAPEPPRRRPSPGFIPPPPGSGNQGPPREARRGPSNQVPPGSGSWQQSPPAMDMSGPPPSRDNMPPWARNGQGSMRGPQSQDMGGPYMGMGGPPRGMGGSPRGMGGPPRGMGGQGGPPGGMDMNNPQVARLIRVARQKMLSAGTGGQSRNPITGEAPEAPEGGAAAGGMNPMMMMALMNQGGGGGSGAGAMGGMDLSALLGGSGGSNPMASLMGGGMPGMGGMGGLGALMGNMGGSSGEGGAMGGMGGMGAMAGLMGLMGGQGNSASAGETPSGGSGANPMAMLQALQAANGGSSGGGNPLAALQALQGGGSMTAPSEGGLNSQMIAALMGNGSGGGSSGGLGALGAMLGNRSGSGGGLPPGLAAAMMNPDGPDFLTSGPFGSFGGLSGMMGGFPGMTQA
ncbi:mucin-5AC-like isoform X14 [Mya arenaria]|uniref:mucin-5AC-like isoform X14 n=1 Tax=Mya arenaria TaxID=6604 RepID=UPI0022E71F0A|nr:mucin-5AC-like isoform X14 [Mya arenaria]